MQLSRFLSIALLVASGAGAVRATPAEAPSLVVGRSQITFGSRGHRVVLRGRLPLDELVTSLDPSRREVRIAIGDTLALASVPYINREDVPTSEQRRVRYRPEGRRPRFDLDRRTGRFRLRSDEAWEGWRQVLQPAAEPMPELDFERETVLVWSQGYGTGGGIPTTFDSAERIDGVLRLDVTQWMPLGVGQYLYHPVTMVRVPLAADRVEVNVRQRPIAEKPR